MKKSFKPKHENVGLIVAIALFIVSVIIGFYKSFFHWQTILILLQSIVMLYRYFYYLNHDFITITSNNIELNLAPFRQSKKLKISDIIKINTIKKNNYTMYIIVNEKYKSIKITTRFVKSNSKEDLMKEMSRLKKLVEQKNWHKDILV